MPHDPYAVLHALLRAEAVRNAPKTKTESRTGPDGQRERTTPKEHGRR
ncbi:hypothetical protein ACFYP4_12695 [Streptomyces sp. NPDC005551]